VSSSTIELSSSCPLGVLMRATEVHDNPWLSTRWSVDGIVVRKQTDDIQARTLLKQTTDYRLYLHTGLSISLYVDQAESYYHNLMMRTPRVFVVCRDAEGQDPAPFLVTASADEANAYVETDEWAEAIDPPPEFIAWIERFVLTHYVPEKKVKRVRKNWKVAQ